MLVKLSYIHTYIYLLIVCAYNSLSIVVYMYISWYANSYSPTGTGGSHSSGGGTDVSTANNFHNDKVEYATPAQAVTIPYKTSVSGEMYALSTKNANKRNQELPLSGKYDDIHGAKHNTQQVSDSISSKWIK